MKSVAIFPKSKEVRVIDHPEPTITSPTQVKLKVLEVGICGTDKELCNFQYGVPPVDSDYLIIGHESLAQVIEAGKDVTDLAVGDLAVVMVRRPCSHEDCLPCRQGRQDFCSTGDYLERGIKGLHGFMSEYIVDEAKYVCKVPAMLREIGVLTEPLTIAEKAFDEFDFFKNRAQHACNDHPSHQHTALVLGAGPVSLLGAMLLRLHSFATHIYSRESNTDLRVHLIKAMGADYISGEATPIETLQKQIGSVDLIYEAMGVSGPVFSLLSLLNNNGVCILTGIPSKNEITMIPTDAIMKNLVLKNQIILGTVNAGKYHFTQAITDLGLFNTKWPDLPQQLVTQRISIHSPMLLNALVGKEPGIKNVITL